MVRPENKERVQEGGLTNSATRCSSCAKFFSNCSRFTARGLRFLFSSTDNLAFLCLLGSKGRTAMEAMTADIPEQTACVTAISGRSPRVREFVYSVVIVVWCHLYPYCGSICRMRGYVITLKKKKLLYRRCLNLCCDL